MAILAGYLAAGGLLIGGAAAGGTDAGGGTDVGGADARSITAVAAGGEAVAARPLTADGSFALAYEHSAYRAPAVELFTAAGRRFTMYAVASPNEAVLDYYAVAGARSRASGWWVLRLDAPVSFDELPLIATPLGRRTLVVGTVCVPLYPRSGSYDLRIRITRSRPVGPAMPCPPGALQEVQGGSMP